MATSADSDSSNPIQLELPYASRRFKGSDVRALVSDTSFREWVANLWNCYQPLLLELAHFHLRDWERAQEVVQEMWVDFIKSVARFEGRCSEKTWLVQILKRCIQKEQRRTVFTRAREAIIGAAQRGRDGYYGARVGLQEKWYESPEQLLLAQERLEQILRARRALPKKQAEVWILR
ncbi:MAG: RNA polymerase sigma factor, partial [Terriglobia bacterium]